MVRSTTCEGSRKLRVRVLTRAETAGIADALPLRRYFDFIFQNAYCSRWPVRSSIPFRRDHWELLGM